MFTSWGTINWLPDIRAWAAVIASLLALGGEFYFADVHPALMIFDDSVAGARGMPGWFAPYFQQGALVLDDARDYANPTARLTNTRCWMQACGSRCCTSTTRWLGRHSNAWWKRRAGSGGCRTSHGCRCPTR